MKKSLSKKRFFCLWLFVVILLFLSSFLVEAQVKAKKNEVKKVEYTSQDLRDPFRSPFEMEKVLDKGVAPEAGLSHLQVQGMVWSSKMPQAIINDTAVRIGEVIEGAEILDIRKEGIYVLYQGRQYIIRPSILKE
jgi:hypothetical protein